MYRTRLTGMYPLHLAPDAPPGDGGVTRAQDPPESRARRQNTLVDALIRRHGSPEAALASLAATNVTLEDENTRLEREVRQQRDKIPDPEKVVVLPKDRVEKLNQFEALKLTAEQVAALQKENGDLKAKVQAHAVTDLAREGAPHVGFDPEATASFVTTRGLHLELRDVEVEVEKAGKKEKVKQRHPYVRPAADERAQLQPLAEYAKTLPAFEQRALKAAAAPNAGTPTPTGTPYPEQEPAKAGGEGGGKELGQQALKMVQDRYPAPSALKNPAKEPSHAA